jgi:hypothetical protein
MHFIEHYSLMGSLTSKPPPELLISRDIAVRARRYLMEFAFSHARSFYGQGGSKADEHAKWIAGYVLARGIREIDERGIYRAYPRLRDPQERWGIQDAMRVLEMQGWATPTKERRGKDTAWRINPAVHDGRFGQVAEWERTRRGEVRKKIANESRARASERA